MDDQLTRIESAVQALLASNEAMRVDIAKLQIQVAFIEQHYATKADIEMVKTMVAGANSAVSDARGEFYRAMQAQTWKLISWMTVVCSALTTAVYFIARNVH
ncbi:MULTISPECIES: hypothetical protein [unclassified Duganella]|uniref:hypothetical protein n=1 Tax=unclassified Duganella TaxID=2636909 RepID=UPI000874D8C2|nr:MULTISPECIES: hypothetical protein [unclassified Duganella]